MALPGVHGIFILQLLVVGGLAYSLQNMLE